MIYIFICFTQTKKFFAISMKTRHFCATSHSQYCQWEPIPMGDLCQWDPMCFGQMVVYHQATMVFGITLKE